MLEVKVSRNEQNVCFCRNTVSHSTVLYWVDLPHLSQSKLLTFVFFFVVVWALYWI